ncbi:hypothetical protein [Vibrio metschnikovii]|uniref:hypothetical protein n=1 Tax=Vibrio metschnikovii TaxID=28172 RepID=UPI00130210DF|nr:hypothetical protein [Vibrio metschnikovii]
MDSTLLKIVLVILIYCLPVVLAVGFLIASKRLSHIECIVWGIVFIALSGCVMPLVSAMKGMDGYYTQTETLNALTVISENQKKMVALYTDDSAVDLDNVVPYFTKEQSEDYSSFRTYIDAYEIFLTFLGLSLGTNILSMGLQGKLPAPQLKCTCDHSDMSLVKLDALEKMLKNTIVGIIAVIGVGLVIIGCFVVYFIKTLG